MVLELRKFLIKLDRRHPPQIIGIDIVANSITHADEGPARTIDIYQLVGRFLDETTSVVAGVWLNFNVIKIIKNHNSQLLSP